MILQFMKWAVRPTTKKTPDGKYTRQYQVYKIELGGNFDSKEEAEHLAYELNKEAHGELDK